MDVFMGAMLRKVEHNVASKRNRYAIRSVHCVVLAAVVVAMLLSDGYQAAAGENLSLPVPGGTLHGTLEMPAGKQGFAVGLIIGGSGPTDRDGNNPLAGTNNSLKMLAKGLADQGVASLRFDKRGIGASRRAAAGEKDLRFETYIDDAARWCALLESDSRFSIQFVIGHSEGSLIGMLASRTARVDGFISIAGAADPASRLLLNQLRVNLPGALYRQSEAIVDRLAQGMTAPTVPPELDALFRPSVQPYLISWFRYDPAVEIAKLQMPILIVQGTTDIQVPVDHAHRLASANPLAEVTVIDGMNHIFKSVSLDVQQQIRSYGDPTLPVVTELVGRIVRFVQALENR
jgi:hypothetical protein